MKNIFKILFIVIPFFSNAQKQGNIWYFGEEAGLNFNSGSPIAISGGQIKGYPQSPGDALYAEGSSVISDSSGNLLFYSNGEKIWNKNHQVMPNGNNLMGHYSSTQGVFIVPSPNSNRFFYIFTTGVFQNSYGNGFRYSIVDMCLDNHLGDIAYGYKNILLMDSTNEKIAVTYHSNHYNIWIVTHNYVTNKFYSFLLTDNGITDTVISVVGSNHATYSIGQMKISPSGLKLALAANGNPSIVELFDFNPSTGLISNPISLPTTDGTPAYLEYGVSFSPNSSKLYINGLQTNLVQYNLLAGSGNPSDIIASKYTINSSPQCSGAGIQLGPDGKIYISRCSNYLSVILDPDNDTSSCHFVNNYVFLNAICNYTLPSFIDNYNYFNTNPDCPDYIPELNSENIKIYPNPVTDEILINHTQKATIEISNINGNIVKSVNHNSGETSIYIGDLSVGVYIIKVKTYKEIVTKKFVKE